MIIYSIGFSGKSASKFFELLETSSAVKLIDTRANRTSQLSGFAKQQDLEYLVPKLTNLLYEVNSDLAPTKELLSRYRKNDITWIEYETAYLNLLETRQVFKKFELSYFDRSIILCSEADPQYCHRRLLIEKLQSIHPVALVSHLE